MSTTKAFARNDAAPQVRQAGAIPKGSEDTSLICMRPDLYQQEKMRELTPERIKKYRQSAKQVPG